MFFYVQVLFLYFLDIGTFFLLKVLFILKLSALKNDRLALFGIT